MIAFDSGGSIYLWQVSSDLFFHATLFDLRCGSLVRDPPPFWVQNALKWRNLVEKRIYFFHQFIGGIKKIVGLGSFGVGGEGAEVLCGQFLNHKVFRRKL
jgi:hypothetical protein